MIKFEIEKKIIRYFDDMWKEGIQIMPKDKSMIEKLKKGGMNQKMMAALIIDANKGSNYHEYLRAKDDKKVSEIIIKDCRAKGLMEAK